MYGQQQPSGKSYGILMLHPPFIFGVLIYLIAAATFIHVAYFLFITDPKLAGTRAAFDILINLVLLSFFAFQHSFMASIRIKKLWDESFVAPLQRVTYILMTCLTIEILITFWRSFGPILWDGEDYWVFFAILHGVGWLLLFMQSWKMDHWELFGLKQISSHFYGQREPLYYKEKKTQRLYAHFRHPTFIPLCLLLWAAPIFTLDRFLLATGLTFYLLVANSLDADDVRYVAEGVQRNARHASD
jgi:hypothetical protein